MLVTTLQIVAKIKELPADFAEHVCIVGTPSRKGGGTAEVQSFSDPIQETPYTVHIEMAEVESNLNVTCTCKAVKLCMHVVAFYAKFKGLKPPAEEPVPLPLEEGEVHVEDESIAKQQEASKKRTAIYDQISAAFAYLAELEEK